MFEFAQTNLQLYRQMEESAYSQEDRDRIAIAYRFLIPRFSGMYRGTEKPFIAHLVGTASIIAAYRAPVELVLAGLLHAVYMAADFGFQPGTRQTKRKQRQIRALVGDKTESIIATYDALRWNATSIEAYLRDYQLHSDTVQDALTLRLANTLEDFLDYGVNYCAGVKRETMSSPRMQKAMLSLAKRHSWPGLTRHLEAVITEFNAGVAPIDTNTLMGQSRLILPPSSQRKLLPTGQGWIVRRLRRLKGHLRPSR